MKKILVPLVLILCSHSAFSRKQFKITSPDSKIVLTINVSERLEYSVLHKGDTMLCNSPISMTLSNGVSPGINPRLLKVSKSAVDDSILSPIYKKRIITEKFNQLLLSFAGNYSLIFRVYDDGVAYRFCTAMKSGFLVLNEQADFNFTTDSRAYIAYVNNLKGKKDTFEKQFFNSFENTYQYSKLTNWDSNRLAFTPLLVESKNRKKIAIVESDLFDYPGMYLHARPESNQLYGVFAAYPKEMKQGGHNLLQEIITSRETYIARCNGFSSFPWRALVIADNDAQLANNDMVYKLAKPSTIKDVSWIKPGKVAWDWWNDWNIRGVDFKTGVNNQTYKYYIDFASKAGIEYVILDEGWAVNKQADLFQVVPEIDLKELVDYANRRNVGLILWAGYYAFNKNIEKVCQHYSAMGIKGFKIDFMDRDDQAMVAFHDKAARIAAQYKLLVDFHGTYKPTGLQRTYPNVINFEGVHGLEQMKWSEPEVDQVTYDVTIPFIRMLAGPMDYTQGAMRNATRANYTPVYNEPMSQGTRCHQLAEYVIFESPLNMLCDNPSNYMAEEACTAFIAKVPTVWNQTIALNGEVAKYLTIARRKAGDWYVGSLNNWEARSLDIDLSFLGNGEYEAEVFQDGVNANRAASDFKKMIIPIPSQRKMTIQMASGGGYVMRIYKKQNSF